MGTKLGNTDPMLLSGIPHKDAARSRGSNSSSIESQ